MVSYCYLILNIEKADSSSDMLPVLFWIETVDSLDSSYDSNEVSLILDLERIQLRDIW